MTRVTTVIPTYNRRSMVLEAVESALSQTFEDHEVIVVDDGSTDGTAEALRDRFGERVQVHWQSNQGESAARNAGIHRATGDYVAFLDSDDIWLPDKLSRQVAALEACPEAVLALGPYWLMDEEGGRLAAGPMGGELTPASFEPAKLGISNTVHGGGSTALVRRDALIRTGGFDIGIRYGEDWDMWLRLRIHGPFIVVPDPVANVRRHRGSQWHAPTAESIDERLASHLSFLDRFFRDWPGVLPATLAHASRARQYAQAAQLDYLIGRVELGRDRFMIARMLDSTYGQPGCGFAAKLVADVLVHADMFGLEWRDPVGRVRRAMTAWPIDAHPLTLALRRQILGDVLQILGFRCAAAGDLQSARACLLRALVYRSSLACNRGTWSIIVRSFLPASTEASP